MIVKLKKDCEHGKKGDTATVLWGVGKGLILQGIAEHVPDSPRPPRPAARVTPAPEQGPSGLEKLDGLMRGLADRDAKIEKLQTAKEPIKPQLAGEAMALDGLVKTLEAAIKHIDEAKPTSPADKKDPPKKDPPPKKAQ